MAEENKPTRMSIDALQSLLNREDEHPLRILPNGEVVFLDHPIDERAPKPLTMRENLGGEYGQAQAHA